MLFKNLLDKLSLRSMVVLVLVFGTLYLAITDQTFRPTFGDLAKVGVGGYLGQLIPKKEDET